MIDIHCHLLPGIDDGAKSPEDTLVMLKSAVTEGITTIAVSPHHNLEYNNERPLILEKVKEVRKIVNENHLPIEILPGQEVRIYGDLLKDYAADKLVTSTDNSHYMLVEFPSDHAPRYAKEMFYEMKLEGLQPVLVHPERNTGIIEQPNLLYEYIEQGVLSQITASSITGHFGKKIQKFTFQLIEHNLTHFIASDAHNVTSRAFKMKEAFEQIRDEFDTELAIYYEDNAEAVIADKMIYPQPASPLKIKKFLGIF